MTDCLCEPAVRMGGSASGSENYHPSAIVDVGLRLLQPPPRARVWEEERHRYLPAWSVRRFYRLLITPMAFSRRSRQPARSDPTHATWLANVN